MLEPDIPGIYSTYSGETAFVMVRDTASSNSMLKYMKVSAALRSHFKAKIEVDTPRELGMDLWKEIAPTIDIVHYRMETGSHSEIHDALKEQLYFPAKDAKKDMFRLSAHGLLIAA